ncbi:hypothetical protein B484DRAFT_407038, partial [Ochromonadaceae sp. CCMP2298]
MIEILIINAYFFDRDAAKYASLETYCVIKSFGKELERTAATRGTEPIYSEKFTLPLDALAAREGPNNRPFFLETLEVEVWEGSSKLYETRIPIANVGLFKSYRLISCGGGGQEDREDSRLFVRMNRLEDDLYDTAKSFLPTQLCEQCPPHLPLYGHLFMDFAWSAAAFSYRAALAGPSCGELLGDCYHHVE